MAPAMMKAAFIKAPNSPIVVEEVAVPKPTPRQLLIKTVAASLCHSDLNVISGLFGSSFLPVIMGHEAIGVVEEIGPEAETYGFKIGQVVGGPLWDSMCFECTECRTVGPEFCSRMKVKGFTCPGYFSEYSTIDAAIAVVVAEDTASSVEGTDIQLRSLCSLFCAGITVWDALERAQLRPGETVAVIGVGGLGHLALQYASRLGAKVIALDINEEQLQHVKSAKLASDTINSGQFNGDELVAEVRKCNSGRGVDVSLVASGVLPAYASGLSILKPTGRLIMVGQPHQAVPFHALQMTNQCLSVIGARVPGQKGAQRCLDFTLRHDIKPHVNQRRFKLEDLNEMVSLMQAGKVGEGRMVVDFM